MNCLGLLAISLSIVAAFVAGDAVSHRAGGLFGILAGAAIFGTLFVGIYYCGIRFLVKIVEVADKKLSNTPSSERSESKHAPNVKGRDEKAE